MRSIWPNSTRGSARWPAALALCCVFATPVRGHDSAVTPEAAQAYELGRQYRAGAGRPRDAVLARRHLTTAAQLHHPPAMFALSNMLAAGEGGAPDELAARRWLEQAADLEYPEALQQLALHLQDGTLGYAPDRQRAAQLLRLTAHALKHRRQGE
jgi:TPR repeat protein